MHESRLQNSDLPTLKNHVTGNYIPNCIGLMMGMHMYIHTGVCACTACSGALCPFMSCTVHPRCTCYTVVFMLRMLRTEQHAAAVIALCLDAICLDL